MAFELANFDVMEHLWDSLEKTPDGHHVQYWLDDIIQLWYMGFVDTSAITAEDWIEVFEPYKQPDNSFLVGKPAFLALEQYRYKGEVRIPFDAMQINEGRYTEDGLDDLIHASIEPSCSLPRERLREFFDTFKRDFKQEDGLILVRRPAKERIKTLIDANPSPLRNLEILIDHMIREQGGEMKEGIDKAETDAAMAKAALEASRFSSEPVNVVEEKAKGLKALQKSRHTAVSAEADGVDKVALKKIRRSRKGMRG